MANPTPTKKFDLVSFMLTAGSVALGLTIYTLVNRHLLSKM